MKLLLAVYYLAFMEIVNSQEVYAPIQGDCRNFGDLRLVHKRGENFGAIQACRYITESSKKWRYFSRGGGWTEGAARLACRELNLGYLNATSSTLVLTSRVYTRGIDSCTCAETANLLSDCIDDSPRKKTVATVNCSNGDACAVPDNVVIATETAISMETPQPSDGATCTCESSNTQSTVMSTSVILGALIGLLAAALVVVVTGWIVSCVYLQWKIDKKCKDHTHTTSGSTSDPTLQLNNPVYDGSTTVPHTTYSSHGPSYEVINTNEGVGHSYDAISHRGGTRPHPPTTLPVFNEEYSTLDTSRENEYHTLESNTGDGQYSMVGQSEPQNDGPDPQDYEVPAPLRGKSTLH